MMVGTTVNGIIQPIELDNNTNPRIWDVNSSPILGITILDADLFRKCTGVAPPRSPLSASTYADMGLPFDNFWEDSVLTFPDMVGDVAYDEDDENIVLEKVPPEH